MKPETKEKIALLAIPPTLLALSFLSGWASYWLGYLDAAPGTFACYASGFGMVACAVAAIALAICSVISVGFVTDEWPS